MTKKPTPEKSKTIDLVEITRTRRSIFTHHRRGDDDFRETSTDNARPELLRALDALAPLACKILEVPDTWTSNLWIEGIKVGELRDARTVSIHLHRGLTLSGVVLKLTTPPALLSQPQSEGVVFPPLSTEEAEIVETVIEEAKEYIKGNRAQGELDLRTPEEKAEDGESTDPLFGEGPKEDKPKRGRKKKAE